MTQNEMKALKILSADSASFRDLIRKLGVTRKGMHRILDRLRDKELAALTDSGGYQITLGGLRTIRGV